MSNALAIIRSLIIYSLCLPLAILVGYWLAQPLGYTSAIIVAMAIILPLAPVILRWHHFLLIASWNFTAVLFFLPGRPSLWIIMAVVSLSLSILQHILNRETKFLSVPSVARPLIFLFLVVLITAKLTGGIGIRAFGGEEFGGKRYILVLTAIIGYFAIACRRVPPGREILYVSVFFLSGLSWAISSMGIFVDPSLYFIFSVFPVESLTGEEVGQDVALRLGGLATAAQMVVWYAMAQHGLRGLFRLTEPWHFLPFRFSRGFQINQPWRTAFVLLAVWISLQGGYRGGAILFAMMFVVLFFLEGLHRSRVMPLVLLMSILSVTIGLPMVSKLPPMVQRALSFLPLEIDPAVRMSAEVSTEWRERMWSRLLPTVPQYLLLGKGYTIDPGELLFAKGTKDTIEGNIAAGDYHNGPLTLLIPLGIWGAIGFLWFLGASIRVLYRNFRYGDAELRAINTFLLSYFVVRAVSFFVIFGSFYLDFCVFTGLIALSISINGGMRGPVRVLAPKPTFNQFRLARAARQTAPSAG
jgi:hypothetical protein